MGKLGPFAILAQALSPGITIRVSPAAFEFSCRGQVETIAPVLYLTGAERNQKIAAVGDSVAPPGPYTRISLLDPTVELEPPITRVDALEGFFRYAFIQTIKRSIMLRPTVTVLGIETIVGAFGGSEAEVLREALMVAGAHRVVFSSSHAA